MKVVAAPEAGLVVCQNHRLHINAFSQIDQIIHVDGGHNQSFLFADSSASYSGTWSGFAPRSGGSRRSASDSKEKSRPSELGFAIAFSRRQGLFAPQPGDVVRACRASELKKSRTFARVTA